MHYVAYTDESYTTAERYRSICAFSMPQEKVPQVYAELREMLANSDVREFKWQKLKDARYGFCGEKLVNYLIDNCRPWALRVDVVIWDTHDQRHAIQSRDDRKNFERMFFHLLKCSMLRRDRGAKWSIYPDQRLDVDWATVADCLHSVGKWEEYFEHPLLGEAFSEQFFDIETLEPVDSLDEPCCQLADLFAGLAAFSRKHAEKFGEWRRAHGAQGNLFRVPDEPPLSNRERQRFTLVEQLAATCRSRSLGVSLRTEGYLRTPNPENPINFWHYEPQREFDRAPTRDG